MRASFKTIAIVAVLITCTLSGCGQSQAEKEAAEHSKDIDTSQLSSCSYEDVVKVSLPNISGNDTAAICEKMRLRMGKTPSIQMLRELSKAVTTLHYKGSKATYAEDAYQLMSIVESRGQLERPDAMIDTFNVAFKIFVADEGRVSLKELNVLLRASGDSALKISDDGIYYMAAVLSVRKQDAGE